MYKDCVQCGTEYWAHKSRQKFCSFDCRDSYKRTISKYDLQWVLDNVGEKNTAEMAAHFGVSDDAFKKQVTLWRGKGIDIPDFRKNRKKRLMAITPKEKNRKQVKQKKSNMRGSKASNSNYMANAAQKKRLRANEQRFKTVKQDLSTKKPVKIPGMNMTVYVDINADPEAVIAKYKAHRKYELTGR